MAINAYVGLQGSGKSYEVVSSVLLDAISLGRRVVTNIDGVNEERIHEYLINERNADPDKLGVIVLVGNDRIMEPAFFPDEEKPEVDSVVKGGDLVAVDEAWRFWGTDNGKLSHEHMQFFRMHRHYVHPVTHVACDVVLMTQDITGLHRSVKNVVEFVFRMQKYKSLGFSGRYRVDIYDGWKISTKTRIDHRLKKYSHKIFPLYKSYAGGTGQERQIDKRQNIFRNPNLWAVSIICLLIAAIGWRYTWRFFHPPEKIETTTSGNSRNQTSSTTTPSPSVASQNLTQPTSPPMSQNWRIVGSFSSGNERWVIVSDSQGRLRAESPSAFHATGISTIGEIDEERVTYWTGDTPQRSASFAAGAGK